MSEKISHMVEHKRPILANTEGSVTSKESPVATKDSPVVSEAVVEKVKVVKGNGSGADCDAICGEEIVETFMFVTGRGSGANCDAGNTREKTTRDENRQLIAEVADKNVEMVRSEASCDTICGEEIVESIMFVTGRGMGAECDARNNRKKPNGVATNGAPKPTTNGSKPGSHDTSGEMEDDIPVVAVKSSAKNTPSNKKKAPKKNASEDEDSDEEVETPPKSKRRQPGKKTTSIPAPKKKAAKKETSDEEDEESEVEENESEVEENESEEEEEIEEESEKEVTTRPESKKKTTGGSKVMSRRRKRESLEGNRRFVRAHVLKITVVVHFSSPPVFSPFQQMAVKVQRWRNTQPQYT